MEKNEKIKKKIKALLSKTTDNGATREEMESSLKKANELMLEFFITEHDLKDVEIIKKCIKKEVPLIKSGYDLSLFYPFLAKLFDCEYFYNSRRIVFFGFEQDTEMCDYFYNLIVKACLNETKEYKKTAEYDYLTKFRHGKSLIASFIKGYLLEVSEKMETMYKDRKSNIPESYGLMVIEKENQVNEQFKALNIKIKSTSTNVSNINSMAFESGCEKGSQFEITQGLEASENTTKEIATT